MQQTLIPGITNKPKTNKMSNQDKILLQTLNTLITVYNNQTDGEVSVREVMNFEMYVRNAVENFDEKMEEFKTTQKL